MAAGAGVFDYEVDPAGVFDPEVNSSGIFDKEFVTTGTGVSSGIFASAGSGVFTGVSSFSQVLWQSLNNYLFVKVGDGMSTSEKIR